MNIIRKFNVVEKDRWMNYNHTIYNSLGENGQRLTGSQKHIDLSREAAVEGMVLLENNGILPLKEGSRVAIFGIGSIDYVKGGGGSGQVFSSYIRNVYEGLALKSPRVSVWEPISKYYYDYMCEHIDEFGNINNDKPSTEIEVPTELLDGAKENADIAVVVIHRYSGEGYDRVQDKGDFLLTDIEENLVKEVAARFDKTVAVLDIGGMIDASWIKKYNFDAALLAWQAGQEGGLAIADILCGDCNPSGKLVDTFAANFSDYPSADTFNKSDDYVEYFEDIYVGYRYFETIKGAAEKVDYPFGYGLSYTDFEFSKPVGAQNGDNIEITFSVKNIGSVAGKEVAQCYYSAPQGKLGKPALELAAFKKTRLLSPGESEEIKLTFKISDMASYDDLGKCQMSAYILEGGEYTFHIGNSCRNTVKAEYSYVVNEEFVVTEQLTQKCAPNKLEKRLLSDGSFEALPSYPIIKHEIVREPNKAEKPEDTEFIEVAEGKITLDEFMAQLTNDELIHLVGGIPNQGLANTCGFGDIDRLKIPAFMTADGPAGLRLYPKMGIPTTAFPCATLLACTWNPEIVYEIGKAGAIECKENGIAIWLTPALNIHRNPLCGRNFEYFSEDPLIAGVMAAAKVKGIQSTKTACSIKHFACNNKETNRFYSDSRLSERALREIYLKGFEICVKTADPWTIMTSYNIINARRSCECYELIQGILRDEWGFGGIVTSDWGVPCDHAEVVKAGNDIRMPDGHSDELAVALKYDNLKRSDLEFCAKHLLELFLKFD